MSVDAYQQNRIDELTRKGRGHDGTVISTSASGRRRTCRYVEAPQNSRCTGLPVGSEVAEVELCIRHLRLTLELVAAENIQL